MSSILATRLAYLATHEQCSTGNDIFPTIPSCYSPKVPVNLMQADAGNNPSRPFLPA